MTTILTTSISELVYLKNFIFVDTVLQGTLEIGKSQEGAFYIGKQTFNTSSEVIMYCGYIIRIRVFDVDTESEVVMFEHDLL